VSNWERQNQIGRLGKCSISSAWPTGPAPKLLAEGNEGLDLFLTF
jgi:hypothetical protein